jgi:hypothetical protein
MIVSHLTKLKVPRMDGNVGYTIGSAIQYALGTMPVSRGGHTRLHAVLEEKSLFTTSITCSAMPNTNSYSQGCVATINTP